VVVLPRTYTVARVTPEQSLPLFTQHVRRLGDDSRPALRHFASQAEPGVYRLWWNGVQLETLKLPGTALREGMPTRFLVSPFAEQRGRFAKPAPPSAYDGVRLEGVATLLTDARGEQLYESCRASLLAWDGASLVLPPEDVPAVRSVAEAEVLASFTVRRAAMPVVSAWPLLLLNAVEGTCGITVEGRGPFPAEVRAKLDAVLRSDR
jgi:hypothetical protein